MRRICVFIFALYTCYACNTDQTKNGSAETNNSQPPVITSADTQATRSVASDVNAGAKEPNYKILPGKSIGLANINEQAQVINRLLGKPDKTDAAMGKLLATWYSKPDISEPDTVIYETDIFFARDLGSADENSKVKQIRITAPVFRFENEIGINSDLKTIQAYFPSIKKVATYTAAKTRKPIAVYQDSKAGIAFETDTEDKCVGIAIQEPGKNNLEVYSAVSTDLKKF